MKNTTKEIVRKGGIGENIPNDNVVANIGRPGQIIIIKNEENFNNKKVKK